MASWRFARTVAIFVASVVHPKCSPGLCENTFLSKIDSMKHYLGGLFVLLFASLSFAQYEVSVTTIDVWVKATDKSGQAITGLKQEDFQLLEDGQPVQSTCFEESVIPRAAAASDTPTPQESLPELPAKRFVIFLDLYNTSQPEFLYIRPKLLDFVKRFSSGDREIMLAGIRADRKMGVFSPFTKDSSKIEGLIGQAQGNVFRDRNLDEHESDLQRILSTGTARGGVEEAVQSGFQMADSFAKEDAETTRFSLGALQNFINWLAKQSQTEHSIVLYVSGGFTVDPGRRYFDLVDRYTEDHREVIQSPDIVIHHRGNDFDFRRMLEENIGKLNRLNVTIYTINTRGLVVSDPDISKNTLSRTAADLMVVREFGDALDIIAQETGGTSFSNSQNFKLGFNNVIQDLDHQYLLCYNAPEHKEKDKYHKISVKTNRSDAVVRHRNGYLD